MFMYHVFLAPYLTLCPFSVVTSFGIHHKCKQLCTVHLEFAQSVTHQPIW